MRAFRMSGCICLVATLVLAMECPAQIVPYRSSGMGAYNPAQGEYVTRGQTRIGRFGGGAIRGSGTAIPVPTADPLVFDWFTNGPVEETFRNGDQIFYNGGGQVELIPLNGTWYIAIWQVSFDVAGGTGRFANVGPGFHSNTGIAVNFPFVFPPGPGDTWYFLYDIRGSIDLGN